MYMPRRAHWKPVARPRVARCGGYVKDCAIPCRIIERKENWRNVFDVLLSLSNEYI
jgi:hypothetical protein